MYLFFVAYLSTLAVQFYSSKEGSIVSG